MEGMALWAGFWMLSVLYVSLEFSTITHQFTLTDAHDCRQGKPPGTASRRCPAAGHWQRPGSLSALGRRCNHPHLHAKATESIGAESGTLGVHQAMRAQT